MAWGRGQKNLWTVGRCGLVTVSSGWVRMELRSLWSLQLCMSQDLILGQFSGVEQNFPFYVRLEKQSHRTLFFLGWEGPYLVVLRIHSWQVSGNHMRCQGLNTSVCARIVSYWLYFALALRHQLLITSYYHSYKLLIAKKRHRDQIIILFIM